MCGSKPLIVIGICTRQRNALLRRLLNSIWAQPIPDGYDVQVIVVDNNNSPIAAQALTGLTDQFEIKVVYEPQAGLVFARNRALDEAASCNATWFIGVDDDEWVAADWLAQLINGMETLASPILIAPCRYVFGDDLSPFLEPKLIPVMPRGAQPAALASSNFAIHYSVFGIKNGHGMRFDLAFNESGGEDLDFFLRAKRLYGWVAASWPDAVVFENWNGLRATLRYQLSRGLRNQLSIYQVVQHHRRTGLHGSRFRNLTRILSHTNRHAVFAIGNFLGGVMLLPLRRREGRLKIGRGLLMGAKALAVVPFVLGRAPIAYGPRIRP